MRKKLLMIRFSALGDVAMLAPVVKELAAALPELDVTVLSQPFCAPLFRGLGSNVSFIGADIKREYHGVKGLERLFGELDGMGFDYVADMHGVLRTHYLRVRFRMNGYAVARIDKRRGDRKRLTACGDKKVMRQLSTSFEKYRGVLRRLPIEGIGRLDAYAGAEDGGPVMSFGSVDKEVSAMLGSDGGRRIGIAPFAAHEGKIYPLEKTERVVELLTERQPGVRIYLFGGGGRERERMLSWQRRWPRNVVAASPVLRSMERELQLMSRLDVMLTMDSANMHLASLVGTRAVSVWGATHPFAGFLGWRQREDDCVQLDIPCRPCSIFGNKPCFRGDFACMNGISPEMIVERVMQNNLEKE
ncbi:MAG: glycosyltransferase family 9 protein [Prevotella sp.]|nr:glycosyltransferase family 9 protein [Prevotella sp.]